MLTFEQIDAAADTAERTVTVKEWGGDVKIKPLTFADMRKIRDRAKDDDARLNATVLSDGMVEPPMTFAQALRVLETKASGAVMTVISAIMEGSEPTTAGVAEATEAFRG